MRLAASPETAKLGQVATTGGNHVAAYTLSQQADRAELHSHRAVHDDSQTGHRGIGDRPSSESIYDAGGCGFESRRSAIPIQPWKLQSEEFLAFLEPYFTQLSVKVPA